MTSCLSPEFNLELFCFRLVAQEGHALDPISALDAVTREIDALTARERENGLTPAERRQLAELLLHKQKLRARTKAQDS